jgi:hypothetical protein
VAVENSSLSSLKIYPTGRGLNPGQARAQQAPDAGGGEPGRLAEEDLGEASALAAAGRAAAKALVSLDSNRDPSLPTTLCARSGNWEPRDLRDRWGTATFGPGRSGRLEWRAFRYDQVAVVRLGAYRPGS